MGKVRCHHFDIQIGVSRSRNIYELPYPTVASPLSLPRRILKPFLSDQPLGHAFYSPCQALTIGTRHPFRHYLDRLRVAAADNRH